MPSSKRKSHGFRHRISAPLRLISHLRDMYVNNMNKFATQMSCEYAFGYPSLGSSSSSYSLRSKKSCSSLDDELADLIRAAAEKNRRAGSDGAGARNVRSRSVAITRIDEDKPCDFKDCDLNLGSGSNFARTRSCTPAYSGPFGSRARY